ncbi:DUF4325 domain-containing protein [Solirubrobacter ginsenosidimutans]|uniref:DUF4325 domain-containing protein n=1 Tax=Solirubrobacter ginsenosidimutans TaxID=490573 RepID=A0A9X3RZ82_9ACTN|nr:DUF4325 domain-containing protein [Solirubrobacter ginsenosidimutans]MDA0160650.1 DUF4325 domain-containing protein [Solirubrobacter ginsenosidimutans]
MSNTCLEWADDNQTLVFRRLKKPEVLELIERTQLLHGALCNKVTFDLSGIDTAFSAQALPLVIVAHALRQRGVQVDLILPGEYGLRTLFTNTNWAHLIAPHQFDESTFDGHHMHATTYSSSPVQQEIVNGVMDLLLEEGHIDRPILGALEWALNEVTDNVLVHSGSHGIVQVTRYQNEAHIVVCDAGRGIGASMRDAFPALTDDVTATQRAILPGVTSGPGQGNGLAGINSIARLAQGEISLISGRAFAMLSYGSGRSRATWAPVAGSVAFPGTAVVLQLPLNVHLDLREALRFQSPDWEPWDFIDARYEPEDGELTLRLAEERRGVGSREAGHAIRTKTENLLDMSPTARLTIDFSGVRMIASSFADEFMGKLRLALGVATFDERIRLIGLDPSIEAVVRGAISQRMR